MLIKLNNVWSLDKIFMIVFPVLGSEKKDSTEYKKNWVSAIEIWKLLYLNLKFEWKGHDVSDFFQINQNLPTLNMSVNNYFNCEIN